MLDMSKFISSPTNTDGHYSPHLQQHRRPNPDCGRWVHYHLLLWLLWRLQGEQMHGRHGMMKTLIS